MGAMPALFMFRKFTALNARNLLYLQAELSHLEKKLREQEEVDSKTDKGHAYARDWYWLDQSKHKEDGGNRLQFDLVQTISSKLRQYNDMLLKTAAIAKLERPERGDVQYLQAFLMQDEMGPLPFIGADALTWGEMADPEGYCHDLITLCPRENVDSFSHAISRIFLNMVYGLRAEHCLKKSKGAPRVHVVEDSKVFSWTSVITNLLASMLPIVSIGILYTVKSMKARLGIIAGLNLLIALCLSAFTNAKRAEVFATSAAFAAVQVVFVGNGQQ